MEYGLGEAVKGPPSQCVRSGFFCRRRIVGVDGWSGMSFQGYRRGRYWVGAGSLSRANQAGIRFSRVIIAIASSRQVTTVWDHRNTAVRHAMSLPERIRAVFFVVGARG